MVYRSYPLEEKNERIARALIVVHGQGRNADDYFRTGMAAAFLAGALEDTIVIAPRFTSNDGRSCTDELAQGEVNWRCAGDSWRAGAAALDNEALTSFGVMDEILRRLARKEVFPNLRRIVISGHSAGGQYVSRYAMANTAAGGLGVPVTYVVSNPSSYAYLDGNRPRESGGFGPFSEGSNCTTFDTWPYGMRGRTGYSLKLSEEHLRKQLTSRAVTYLLGELDTLPIGGFDSSCPAMAQGASRLARGRAYAEYVNERFGAKHKVVVVPYCGHNARCVFTADQALPELFPR
jgi:predicted esterase